VNGFELHNLKSKQQIHEFAAFGENHCHFIHESGGDQFVVNLFIYPSLGELTLILETPLFWTFPPQFFVT
jgi:hypothetical protein